MRFKTLILALNLGSFTAVAHAQILTPTKPAVGMPAVATGAPVVPGAAVPQATLGAVSKQSGALAPGVVSLSDVAKQSNSEPQRSPIPVQASQVPAITAADGTGQPIELARDKMAHVSSILLKPNTSPFQLVRISRVGGDDTAVIWIKGQNRQVTTGSRVLQYTVGEIKEDGVCLYPVKAKAKDREKCSTLLTFQGM